MIQLREIVRTVPPLHRLLARIKRRMYPDSSEIPAKNYCFPTDIIHTNDKWTLRNWGLLWRGFDDEAVIKNAIQAVRANTMVTHDGLLATYDIARHLIRSRIPGAFVEMGCHNGGSAAIIAYAAKREGDFRALHLFDSFVGLPHPNEHEFCEWMAADWGVAKDQCDGQLKSSGALIAEKQRAQDVLFNIVGYPMDRTTFHVGWFQDTVPAAKDALGEIALLRLDGDLYESTLVCLRHLYPQVVSGGIVIVDDFGLPGCRLACEEYFKEIGIAPYLSHIDAVAKYFVKT
jgi:O-methyltransferase